MSHANAALTPRAPPSGRPAGRRRRLAGRCGGGLLPGVLADREAVGGPLPGTARGLRRAPVDCGDDRPLEPPAPHRRTGRRHRSVRRIVHLRWKQRLGPVQIAGAARACRPRPCTRCWSAAGSTGSTHVDRSTGEPIRRYEHDHPGSLVHVDVKKLGNIPDGGGWRFVGRQQGDRNRAATPGTAAQQVTATPGSGHAFVHTVIDDHSRVAYAEIHDDETAATADRGPAPRRRPGSPPAASPSNASCPTTAPATESTLWQQTCAELGITAEADPALPAADQRQDRTLPPHPGRRLGLRPPLRLRISPPQRSASMAPPLTSGRASGRPRRCAWA